MQSPSPHPSAVRRAKLTPHSRRVTALEVAQHWFRRGRDYVQKIHRDYPNFPHPAPDGLYLLSAVEAFFARLHGIGEPDAMTLAGEQEEAMRAARGY